MADSPPGTPLSQRRLLTSNNEGNEENALNFANTPRSSKHKLDQSISCQSDIVTGSDEISSINRTFSVDSADTSEVSVSRLKGWLDDFGKQNQAHYVKNNPNDSGIQRSQSIDSDCESDLSVTRLKGWLDDFGKQNRAHYDKVNHIGKAPNGVPLKKTVRSKSTAAPPPQSIVTKTIRRNTDPSVVSAETKKGPAKTPVRYKSRFQKDEVQATNDGYASVKMIAAWLADDPTADKKMTTVRKGINVINKSRMFEKDLENVIIEESRIMKGSVSSKKELFQSATAKDNEGPCETSSCVSVSSKKKWLEGAFGKKPPQEQAEEDDDDSIVSMSVVEKKQWLQNAFKTAGDKSTSTAPSRFLDSASAPGGPSMTSSRKHESAATTAKLMFQSRSSSRRLLAPNSSDSKLSHTEEDTTAAKHKWQERAAQRSMPGPIDPPESESMKTADCLELPVKLETAEVTEDMTPLQEPCDPPTIQRLRTVASLESPLRNKVARKWEERKAAKSRASPQRPILTSPQRPQLERKHSDSSVGSASVAKKWQERKAAKECASPQRPALTSVTCDPSPGRPSVAKHWQERKVPSEQVDEREKAEAPIESRADEEETFDFRAAREKLVKRSVQNGNPVKVINKVQLRKEKFEKIQQEIRRKADPMGRLKPTWEPAAPEGGPTTSYKKNFVDNIAPKKSFEDLP